MVVSSKTERDQWIDSETPQASKKSSEIMTWGESEVEVGIVEILSINETSFHRRAMVSGKSVREESTEAHNTLMSCELSLLEKKRKLENLGIN